jgi:hypothetical protein
MSQCLTTRISIAIPDERDLENANAKLRTVENQAAYRMSERIRLEIEANVQCFLTTINRGASSVRSTLFPNEWPAKSHAIWFFELTSENGQHTLIGAT